MEDLSLASSLFTMSAKLKHAAISLQKIATNIPLDSADEGNMSWARQFLCAMDLSCQLADRENVSGGLAVQATSIRPTFYSCLFRIVEEANIDNEKALGAFLFNLYEVLGSPKDKGKLTPNDIGLGTYLLEEMSESILVQLNNNGLPRPSTTLEEGWRPISNGHT